MTARLTKLGKVQLTALTVLRIAIGWHFLYEGIVKLLDPNWTSAAFLAESKWVFSGVFHWIVSNPVALEVVDQMNIWGLILIGLGLFFGCLSRLAAFFGAMLLVLYYVANPAIAGFASEMGVEGNYLVIDKNLVEMVALLVLAIIPTGKFLGLDGVIARLRKADIADGQENSAVKVVTPEPRGGMLIGRRGLLKHLAVLPVFGGFVYAYLKKQGWESYEEKYLLAEAGDVDAVTSATVKTFYFSSLKDLKGKVPCGKIGDLELSRLILGGNLIGGWAHARDLIYVSKLVKVYHDDRRICETFRLAEECGINTVLTNPQLCRVINKYWRREKGTIQFISDCGYKNDAVEGVKVSIDGGADACYVQGEIADNLAKEGKAEVIGEAVELARKNGVPGGVGAHKLETVKACVEGGIKPDFWVKTLHHTNYWSARPDEEYKDNIWCVNPEETIEYMNALPEPWIAFKILAAGAIDPAEGFSYAFKNGADFICVGMYDFQIVEDANIALDVLNGDIQRQRPWRA